MSNEPTFVIYSPSEASASDDDAGWWSNDDGWTTVDLATAVSAIRAAIDGAEVDAGCWPDGSPITLKATLDGILDLVDGEDRHRI